MSRKEQTIDEIKEEAVARENYLKMIHKLELNSISCLSIEQFVKWSEERRKQIPSKVLEIK